MAEKKLHCNKYLSFMKYLFLLIVVILPAFSTNCYAYQLPDTDDAVQLSSEMTETAEGPDEQAEARAIANELIASASLIEPGITEILQSFESDQVKLVGLEHRLKSEDSLTRKILLDAHDMEVSLEEAAGTVRDVLRYTFCIEEDSYVSVTDQVLRTLEENGITVVKFRNYWSGSGYKGINTNLSTEDRFIFELQFHTPVSFETKEEEHPNYEIARSETATEEERIAAELYSEELYARVPIPEGAPEYVWNPQKTEE